MFRTLKLNLFAAGRAYSRCRGLLNIQRRLTASAYLILALASIAQLYLNFLGRPASYMHTDWRYGPIWLLKDVGLWLAGIAGTRAAARLRGATLHIQTIGIIFIVEFDTFLMEPMLQVIGHGIDSMVDAAHADTVHPALGSVLHHGVGILFFLVTTAVSGRLMLLTVFLAVRRVTPRNWFAATRTVLSLGRGQGLYLGMFPLIIVAPLLLLHLHLNRLASQHGFSMLTGSVLLADATIEVLMQAVGSAYLACVLVISSSQTLAEAAAWPQQLQLHQSHEPGKRPSPGQNQS